MQEMDRMAFEAIEKGNLRILTLATALLGLVVAFRKDIVGDNANYEWLMIVMWAAFLLCVFLCLRFHFVLSRLYFLIADIDKLSEELKSGYWDEKIQELLGYMRNIKGEAKSIMPQIEEHCEAAEKWKDEPPTGLELRGFAVAFVQDAMPFMEAFMKKGIKIKRVLGEISRMVDGFRDQKASYPGLRRSARWLWACIWITFIVGFLSFAVFGLVNFPSVSACIN